MFGSIIAGGIAQGGAGAAANAIGQSTEQALNFAQNQKDVNRSDASPWVSTGRNAIDLIGQLLGFGKLSNPGTNGSTWEYGGDPTGQIQKDAFNKFQLSPGYDFRKQEGINALDRSAAAKGTLRSGAQIKAVQGFGDNLASDEYRNWMGDLFNASGLGQSALASSSGLNTGLTNSMGNWTTQGGVARGSAYQSGANAMASGISNGINNVMAGAYLAKKAGFF